VMVVVSSMAMRMRPYLLRAFHLANASQSRGISRIAGSVCNARPL
jgi:hypothetical protein